MVRTFGYVVALLFLFVLFSASSLAQGFGVTITGGLLYSTLDMEEFNASIREIKEAVEADAFINDEEREFEVYQLDHMDLYDSMPGFFVEAQKSITDQISIGAKYEYLQTSRDFNYNIRSGQDFYEEEIFSELLIEGGTLLLYYDVDEHITLSGGVGYYLGQMTIQGVGNVRREGVLAWYEDGVHFYFDGAIGYRVGASYNYPITPNFSVNAAAQYRMLEMKIQGDEYYGKGLTSEHFHGLNGFRKEVESETFNGFVFKGGLSFNF